MKAWAMLAIAALALVGLRFDESLPVLWAGALQSEVPVPDRFTVALFHFDEKDGDGMADAAGSGAGGVKGKSAEWAVDAGRFKGALRIHGRKEGSVAMPSVAIPTGKLEENVFSIDFWFKLIQDSPIIGRDLYLVSSSNIFFRFAVDRSTLEFGVKTPTGWMECATNKRDLAVAANTWYHLAGTYDGSEARLYVNGKRISSTEGKGPVRFDSLLLGCVNWDPKVTVADFEGLIDELRISAIPREDFGVRE